MPAATISHDRAIETPEQDALGRNRYAEACAAAIAEWDAKSSSLVVGIFGDWGSGKTSLKNLIVNALGKHPKGETIEVVEFNPWQVVNHDNLTKAFFDELAEAAGRSRLDDRGAAARCLEQYSNYLSLGNNPAGLSQPLSVLKRAAAEALAEIPFPILVVMDDLDRLTQTELLLILQLVKANADFPNVIYLLLAQRGSVVKALEAIAPKQGDEFLEKIIQVPLNLPRVERAKVHAVLNQGLERMVKDPVIAKHYDEQRFRQRFQDGPAYFFSTVRDVNRYLSTLSFHLGVFRNGDVLEVNFIDLLALEVLRVFCEPVYRELPQLKEFVTDAPNLHWLPDEQLFIQIGQQRLVALVESSPEQDRKAVRAILEGLFPIVKPIGPSGGYKRPDVELSDEWVRAQRIGSHHFFDAYFQMAIPETGISQNAVTALLEAFGNRERFGQEIRQLEETGELPTALSRLSAYRRHLPTVNLAVGAICLADIPVNQETRRTVSLINHCHILSEPDQDLRERALLRAVSEGGSLLACVSIADYLRTEVGSENILIDFDAVRAVRGAAMKRIASETRWLQAEEPTAAWTILRYWADWGDAAGYRQAVAKLIEKPDGFLRFLEMAVGVAVVTGSFGRETRHFVRLGTLERFVALEALAAASVRAKAVTLTMEDGARLAALDKAVQRRRSGLPDFEGSQFVW
jgi:hypothetical protein